MARPLSPYRAAVIRAERRVLAAALRRHFTFVCYGIRSALRNDWALEDACKALQRARQAARRRGKVPVVSRG